MFAASNIGTWQCKEEIPVVIVQIGYWPQRVEAQRVRDAQRQFCQGDPRAEMVTMNDLSRFYHFDAASFLIGGHRIAQAYDKARNVNITCPLTPPPTASICSHMSLPPTPNPTSAPTAPKKILSDKGNKGKPAAAYPLGLCEGDCNSDKDCAKGLICQQRKSFETVPGCEGKGTKGWDYCRYPGLFI